MGCLFCERFLALPRSTLNMEVQRSSTECRLFVSSTEAAGWWFSPWTWGRRDGGRRPKAQEPYQSTGETPVISRNVFNFLSFFLCWVLQWSEKKQSKLLNVKGALMCETSPDRCCCRFGQHLLLLVCTTGFIVAPRPYVVDLLLLILNLCFTEMLLHYEVTLSAKSGGTVWLPFAKSRVKCHLTKQQFSLRMDANGAFRTCWDNLAFHNFD